MAIDWKDGQGDAVAAILQRHPADSHRCADAAREVLPVARALDGDARALCVRPNSAVLRRGALFVVPKVPVGALWEHHFTVEVTRHCVDALTGPAGALRDGYLQTHWQYADDLILLPAEVPT